MDLEILRLAGTPREMGRQHGEQFAEGARAMCETRIALCLEVAESATREDVLALAGHSLPILADHAPATYEEFRGIAEGAGLSREELLIGNGYTDFVDLVPRGDRRDARPTRGPSECTCFGVLPKATSDGKGYLGQTWDMHGTAFPYVVAFERRPLNGPASITMTTMGCLSLIGINEAGIAIGNTNVTPPDARNGVFYLALIHDALAQTTFEAAVRAITDAPRMSGHYYYLGGPEGEFAAIETTGERHVFLQPSEAGVLAHANHYNDPDLATYAGQAAPGQNSSERESRMAALLNERAGGLDIESLWDALSDHETPICRHAKDPDGSRTCSAAVMCPADRKIWLTKGNPCEGRMSPVECAPS